MGDRDNQRNFRERDLVLGPGEYANILDETKGGVTVYVGPSKASLSATDRPVKFSQKNRRFIECPLEESISTFAFAEKGSYIVLHNPTLNAEKPHPIVGSNQLADLAVGSKINIEGPEAFAPFPGQHAVTIDGHRMRSNQYLIVRVYDEEAAKENWSKATIKLQRKENETDETTEEQTVEAIGMPDLTMGRLLVIEGTKVSFYIPPTGIEVVEDGNGDYVRDAVTLERLEYCILLDEDGNKRYVQGPDVVFPKPTETFVVKSKSRKFKAIELNELMGIYVKVIANYKEEDGTERTTGDELFITGKEQRIYYPRPEHAIIKYGEKVRIYAITIPEGEARYVLDRDTGEVKLKRGPCMFLPDPRKEVIVKRVLDGKDVNLWFPGNREAADYNQRLSMEDQNFEAMVSSSSTRGALRTKSFMAENNQYESFGISASDELKRGTSYTPPRTITIDSKYDGAVSIDVWPGYAVQVVSKTGERKVIVGPSVHLLEYDETLEKISFSTGTPKSDKKIKNDVYLRVMHNTISDVISVETSDLCPVDVVVSYRVNFEGEPSNWFSVENPVKFLTDHLRSVLRNKVKQIGVEKFYANSIDIVRDTILGEHKDGERSGRKLDENGMKVYDLEVLGVTIKDSEISGLLETSQHEIVRQRLRLEKAKRELELTETTEKMNQQIDNLKAKTAENKLKLAKVKAEAQLAHELAEKQITIELDRVEVESRIELDKKEIDSQNTISEIKNEISRKAFELTKEQNEVDLEFANIKLEQTIKELEANTDAVAAKAKAISPQLIETLSRFADRDLAGKLAENFNVLSMLSGKNEDGTKKSVAQLAQEFLGGTGLDEILKNVNLHGHFGESGLIGDK
jgi:major vault protein